MNDEQWKKIPYDAIFVHGGFCPLTFSCWVRTLVVSCLVHSKISCAKLNHARKSKWAKHVEWSKNWHNFQWGITSKQLVENLLNATRHLFNPFQSDCEFSKPLDL